MMQIRSVQRAWLAGALWGAFAPGCTSNAVTSGTAGSMASASPATEKAGAAAAGVGGAGVSGAGRAAAQPAGAGASAAAGGATSAGASGLAAAGASAAIGGAGAAGSTAAGGASASAAGSGGAAGSIAAGAGAAGGGGTSGSAAPRDTSITVVDKTAATQSWWSYQRAGTYTVAKSSVKVMARDGTALGCTLSRPAMNGVAASGTFPGLVMEFTPYVLMADLFAPEAAFFATRGYNALVCTIRGTGDSGGTWQHAFSSQDGRDAYDLVEWLATQSFSNGRIGQLGESYGGQTTYGAAVEQAPHLRAIAPMQPPANLYDDVNYPGGVRAIDDGTINNWPPTAELLSTGAISAQDEYASYRAHPTYDAFWQERTLVGRHDKIQVPVLTIGGWIDGYFRSGTITNIEGALERTWAIYGPWEHMPPVDLGTCDTACATDPLPAGVLLAWFDHWLMELKDLPIPEHPTFVSFESPKGGSRGWRELSAWVPEGTAPLTYQLSAQGEIVDKASTDAPITFHEPGDVTAMGAVASFTGAKLEQDRVLIGRATLDVRAKLSAADANFYVQLLDVDAMDKETLVNDGFLKASHRNSHAQPEPVPVGQDVDYHIVVRPQHYRFVAGHRVRLKLWGGNKDTLEQPSAVDVTLACGSKATLTLPGFARAAD